MMHEFMSSASPLPAEARVSLPASRWSERSVRPSGPTSMSKPLSRVRVRCGIVPNIYSASSHEDPPYGCIRIQPHSLARDQLSVQVGISEVWLLESRTLERGLRIGRYAATADATSSRQTDPFLSIASITRAR